MKHKRLQFLLALLITAATGAWAQEPATPTYSVSVFDGKLNPTTWTGKAGEATGFGTMPLRGVAEGQNVTLKYQGRLKVKSVTAKLEEPVTLATPLTVEALTDGTITVSSPKTGMQYSLNGTAKTSDGIASITVKAGDKVAFYGNGTSITSYYRTTIGGSGDGFQCKVYGNIMSLVDEENFATATELTAESTFFMLFDRNTTLADASSLLLPATTLTSACYGSMFYNCTALTAAPKLPATTLTSACYDSMFYNCTALTAAPELPATKLADDCYYMMFNDCTGLTALPADLLQATKLFGGCYSFMFNGCSGLTAIPDNFLPATTMAEECYSSMFSGCKGLTAIPAKLLPATTMANECYYGMFDGCTGLTAIPDNFLPATTMASECYKSMFEDCTGLTALPATLLPATTLAESCYKCMFEDCTGLTALPDNLLPASTLAKSCYHRMFYGCSGLTALTAIPADLLPATTMAESCYYQMFYGCTGLTAAPLLPATSLATGCYQQMFRDCKKLASVTCLATSNVTVPNLRDWLKDAGTPADSPKLYVDPSMTKTDWSNGVFALTEAPSN